MPISLPSNPSDGQTYSFNSITWVYSSTDGAWKKIRAAAPDLSGGTVSIVPNNWGTLTGTSLQSVLNSIDTAIGTINADIAAGVTVQDAFPSMLYKAVTGATTVNNTLLSSLGLTSIPQMHMLTLRLSNSSGSTQSVSYDASISDIGSTAAPSTLADDSSYDFLLWTYDTGSSWNMMYILTSVLSTGDATPIIVEPVVTAPQLVHSQIQHFAGPSSATASDVIDFDSVHLDHPGGLLEVGDLLLVVYQGTGAFLNTDRVTAPAGWTQLFGFAEDEIISTEEPPGPTDNGGSSDDEEDYSAQMIAYYRVLGPNDPGNLGSHTWQTTNGTGSRLLSLAVVRGQGAGSLTYTTNFNMFSSFKGNTANNDIWNGGGDSGNGAATNSPTPSTHTLTADSVNYSANSLVLGYVGYFNKGNSANVNVSPMRPKIQGVDFLSTPSGMISHGIEGTPEESTNSLRHVQKIVSQTYGSSPGSTGSKTSSTKEATDTYNNGLSVLIVIPS
ncbi:MAG: hypothetical protein VW907_00600 [Opitutae bacterium]